MNNIPDIQDELLRKHYSQIEQCPMPQALRENIISKASARDKRFSLRDELWGIVAAIAVAAAMIWVACEIFLRSSLQYDPAIDIQFKIPDLEIAPPDFKGTGSIVAICGIVLLLAVCHTLLLRRFYRKHME